MSNVLVIGGTVFLSEMVAKKFILEGHVVDILTRGRVPLSYSGVRNHFKCDRRNPNEIMFELRNREYDTIVDICVYDAEDVKILLNALPHKIKYKYILCSTCSVYDITKTEFIENDSELVDIHCENKYAKGKISAEEILKTSGVDWIIIRPSYIYGEKCLIGREQIIFDSIKNNQPIYVPNLDEKFNPIYVKDLANIFYEVSIKPTVRNKIYIVGGKEIVTFREYLSCCEQIVGKKAIITNNKLEGNKFPYICQTIVVDNSYLLEEQLLKDSTVLYEGLRRIWQVK